MSAPASSGKIKLKRVECCFILNLRGKGTKTAMPIAELYEMVLSSGGITETENSLLSSYITPPPEIYERYKSEGWHNKTYDTIKNMADLEAKKYGVFYTPHHTTEASSLKIARLLFFFQIKEVKLVLKSVSLSRSQLLVLNQEEGIIVVNSGPGTGKTETAAHKAAKLMNDGVLVVSFTNAAVNNFMSRLLGIVSDISEISKKPGKNIWLSTIDSIAKIIAPAGQRNTDFELIVDSAVRDIDRFGNIFLKTDGTPLYRHMIVDEGQDVKNGYFKFLIESYKRWGFKSLTIIGDPKQRLDIGAGGVYQQMLVSGNEAEESVKYIGTLERPLVIKYDETYRFENPILLELCNILSADRPEIHAELKFSAEGRMEPVKLQKYAKVEEVASDIIVRVQAGLSPSKIAIISPITEKAGPIKTKLDSLCEMLAVNEIMTSSEIQADSIYKTSIQSVKGLEFDYVYFIGASGFPSYMNQTYQDVNDGKSMNFVANTRARKLITYLTDETMRPPMLVPDNLTVGGAAKEMTFRREIYPITIKTNDISASDYAKFYKHNMLQIVREEVASFLPVEYAQYEIISAILAMRKGKSVFSKGVNLLPTNKYSEHSRRGDIYDMCHIVEDKVFAPDIYHSDLLRLCAEHGYDYNDISMHKLFKKCFTGRESNISAMEEINDVLMKVSRLFGAYTYSEEDESGEVHVAGEAYVTREMSVVRQIVIKERIWASALRNSSVIVIFTENIYLASLVKKKNPNMNVYMVGLETGKIMKIQLFPHSIKQLQYMVKSLFSITVHIKLERGRGRYSIANADMRRPWYFVDTEFKPRCYRKSGTVYDIALINGYDPYASTCSYIRCEQGFFQPYHSGELEYLDLMGAPTAEQFYNFFSSIVGEMRPLVWYFAAKHDVAILYEFHEAYDNVRSSTLKEDWEMREQYEGERIDYGFDFKNARVGNGRGTLEELYEKVTLSKVSSYKHIFLHTAVPDTLLLKEYVMTRELGNVESDAQEVEI
jgi:hypothetical protein